MSTFYFYHSSPSLPKKIISHLFVIISMIYFYTGRTSFGKTGQNFSNVQCANILLEGSKARFLIHEKEIFCQRIILSIL